MIPVSINYRPWASFSEQLTVYESKDALRSPRITVLYATPEEAATPLRVQRALAWGSPPTTDGTGGEQSRAE